MMKLFGRGAVAAAVLAIGFAGNLCVEAKPPADQYLNVAPLPGAGGALNSLGEPDGRGAMQINIPIAYTPGDKYVDIGSFAGQWEGLTSAHRKDLFRNGTNWIGMGFGISPRYYLSAMANSTILFKDSKSVNAQLQILEETDKLPALAIGAQDIANKEKEFADIANVGVGYYAIATKSFQFKNRPLHVNAGYGTARFCDSFIGGVSYSISDSFSAVAEYDGFQMNEAIAWRPGGRFSKVTVTAGFNNKCGILLGLHFTGKMSTSFAPAIATGLLRRWY